LSAPSLPNHIGETEKYDRRRATHDRVDHLVSATERDSNDADAVLLVQLIPFMQETRPEFLTKHELRVAAIRELNVSKTHLT
jgi:hypothetical protein